jgi:hypothetical protein
MPLLSPEHARMDNQPELDPSTDRVGPRQSFSEHCDPLGLPNPSPPFAGPVQTSLVKNTDWYCVSALLGAANGLGIKEVLRW